MNHPNKTFWWLIAGLTAARWLLLAATPIELVADEAHYWEWARHPDLSYTTKGPGIAWLIWLGTQIAGDTGFGVRWLSPLLGAVALWAVGDLARRISGRPEAAVWTALLYAAALPFSFLHIVLTIDSPLFATWTLAMNLGYRVMVRPHDRTPWLTWCALGLTLAFGFVAKYAVLLIVPGFAWHLIATRGQPRPGLRRGLLAALACLSLGLLPVVLWNMRHDWPTLGHLLGHLHVEGGDRPAKPWKPWDSIPDFIGCQLALLGPAWYLLVRGRNGAAGVDRQSLRYLHRIAWPTLVFYAAVAIKTKVQANWVLPAYPALFVATGIWIASLPRLSTTSFWPAERGARVGAKIVLVMAAVAFALLLVLPPLGQTSESLREFRPLGRVTGHTKLAARIQTVRERYAELAGEAPLLIVHRYTSASILAFYLPDQPRTFCAQHQLGGRKTAYDYFADTDLTRADLRGRPVLFIGADLERWRKHFAGADPVVVESHDAIFYLASYEGLAAGGGS